MLNYFVLFSWFHNTKQSLEILNLKVEIAIWFSKCDEYQNYCVLINESLICLGFAVDLLDIGLVDKDLSDTDLDLLETDRDSFPVNILLFSKLSRRHHEEVLKTSSIHHGYVLSMTIPLKRLGRRKIVRLKTSSRCHQDVLKTSSRCLDDQQMFAGITLALQIAELL